MKISLRFKVAKNRKSQIVVQRRQRAEMGQRVKYRMATTVLWQLSWLRRRKSTSDRKQRHTVPTDNNRESRCLEPRLYNLIRSLQILNHALPERHCAVMPVEKTPCCQFGSQSSINKQVSWNFFFLPSFFFILKVSFSRFTFFQSENQKVFFKFLSCVKNAGKKIAFLSRQFICFEHLKSFKILV